MTLSKENKTIELDTVATGHRIKELMEEKNITIKELSEKLQVSFQAVYRWHKGETLPTICNMFVLAQLLEVEVDDILVAKEK